MSSRAVLCAGRIYCDLVFTGLDRMPRLGAEVFAGGLGVHAGGGAFITAATFPALGRPSALCGVLPAEPFGSLVRADADAAGIDLRYCAAAPEGADPQVTVAIVASGDRAFLTRAPGRALPQMAALDGARHLHIGELGTLREHPELLGLARAAGMTVSLDCAWDDSVTPDVAPLIAAVDVFLPNEGEAAQLARLGLPLPQGPITVVKRGAKGASAISADGRIDADAPAVEVRDPTGAGDAFNAGFLDRWLDGAPLRDCLAAGNACGAATVQAVGGVGGGAAIRELSAAMRLDTAR